MNVPSNNCYILRSCTLGNTTVLTTKPSVSSLLVPFVGQHIQISNFGYEDICFSVELSTLSCIDCSTGPELIPITPNPICVCTVLYNYYILTPCNGEASGLPSFFTTQNLYPYNGTTITFFGQGGVCYDVEGITEGSLLSGLSEISVECPQACNCGEEPDAWEITFCDGTNLDPIITSTNLDQYIGLLNTAVYTITYTDGGDIISACGSVSKTLSQVAPAFTGTFSTIFYDCCEKCTQVCYLLEDCQGAVDPIITCTDLSNYVDQIVKLSNCGDICWKVSESETCDDSILLGTVIENFIPEPIIKNNCVYEVSLDPDLVTFTGYEITINNIVHVFNYTNTTALVNNLNSLNLGVFYFSGGYIGVNGLENYGISCLVRTPKPKICTEPTCSTYTNPQDLDFAQACTDCLPPLPPEPVLDLHIRRIKPGYFSTNSCITTEYMDRVNCNFAKQVYDAMLIKRYGITVCCDHDVDSWDIRKQGLDFELLGDPNMCKSTICYCLAPCLVDVKITLLPTCVPPILIEATLDTLCYPAILVDATIALETTLAPCNCYTLEGSDYTIGWIDCCCEYQTANFLTNATVCAHYLPVILEGSVTILAAEDCGGTLCVAPPPACRCYNISPSKVNQMVITYTTCDNIPVTVVSGGNESTAEPFSVCSATPPVQVFPPYNPLDPNLIVIASTGFCTTNCGITAFSVCYGIVVTSNNSESASVIVESTDPINNNPVVPPTTVTSDILGLICSKKFPVITNASANVDDISIVILSYIACEDCHLPLPCVCYEVTITPTILGSSYTYLDCETGMTVTITSTGGIFYICSGIIPFGPNVTSVALTNACADGECVPN